MDDNWTLMKEGQTGVPSRGEWLASFLEPGATIGVDPFLMPVSEWNSLTKCLNGSNMKLISVKTNLVDQVWGSNQPDRPNQPILPLEMKFTGKSWEDKVKEIREQMKLKKADVLILSALDDVAWMLNLRGSDIQFNPVFFSYVAITHTRVYLFVNEVQVSSSVYDVCCFNLVY